MVAKIAPTARFATALDLFGKEWNAKYARKAKKPPLAQAPSYGPKQVQLKKPKKRKMKTQKASVHNPVMPPQHDLEAQQKLRQIQLIAHQQSLTFLKRAFFT